MTVGWRDNATNETGFSVQRCTGAGCTTFAQIAIAPPRNNTGNTSFVDATVMPGNTYLYQVAAVNAAGHVAPTPPAPRPPWWCPRFRPRPRASPSSAVKANGNNYTATLNWAEAANPTNFTVQRATNATVHDRPDHLHVCGRRQDGDPDHHEEHDVLLPDPREQLHLRFLRLDERPAVPHPDRSLSN